MSNNNKSFFKKKYFILGTWQILKKGLQIVALKQIIWFLKEKEEANEK